MDLQRIQKLKRQLSRDGRRLLYYAPDHYALHLLQRWVGQSSRTIAETRQSPWARLLERPLIKEGLKGWGDGLITAQRLLMLQSADPLCYRISFSHWGNPKHRWSNYDQTSRPGYNLVIQLNFSGLHNKAYAKLTSDRNGHPFRYYGHPVRMDQEFTLAWARVDLAEDRSEALIEEIQSDWWKAAQREVYEQQHKRRDAQGNMREWTEKRSRHQMDVATYESYLDEVLSPLGKVWPEAMLTACLQILQNELQVPRIYYHEYRSGCILKNCKPPRSLYTTWPKRFCFEPTQEAPVFLREQIRRSRKLRKAQLSFYVLQ